MSISEAAIITGLITAWVAGAIWSMSVLTEYDCDYRKTVAAILFFVLTIFGIVYALGQKEQRPCLQYETRMMYNAATKTMMPMRYCAQYGEWVEGDKQ